jgi:hypothetical protein
VLSDNTVLNSGSGGDVIATDDIGGVKYQRIKVVLGGDGVNAGDLSTSNPLPVQAAPAASNGLSIFRSIDLDEGALEVVKSAPGCVYGMWVTNTAPTTRFIKFYDATSGTAGVGTPVITFGIPGNSTDDVGGLYGGANGIGFTTGICVGCTTGVLDNDTGAPGTNDVLCNIFFK